VRRRHYLRELVCPGGAAQPPIWEELPDLDPRRAVCFEAVERLVLEPNRERLRRLSSEAVSLAIWLVRDTAVVAGHVGAELALDGEDGSLEEKLQAAIAKLEQ
jgi:hypothetical protein